MSELCARMRLEGLAREAQELQRTVQQNLEACDSLVRGQQRWATFAADTIHGSCLKTGQHSIFVIIIYLLLPIKYIF